MGLELIKLLDIGRFVFHSKITNIVYTYVYIIALPAFHQDKIVCLDALISKMVWKMKIIFALKNSSYTTISCSLTLPCGCLYVISYHKYAFSIIDMRLVLRGPLLVKFNPFYKVDAVISCTF